jgi:plasmid stabilization system protein ParE
MSNFNVRLNELALEDIAKAEDWYFRRLPGLDEKFINKLRQSLTAISEHPAAFSFIQKNGPFRKYKIQGFPYKIFYSIDDQTILITAIIHTSRSNRYIRRRLK